MAKKTSHLVIHDLHARVADQEILRGISLSVKPGEVHAIMGPNGSGKSTLAYTLAGHPNYEVTGGKVTLNGEDVLDLSPDQRSQAGLFLAFQYPIEIPGVRVQNFLKLAYDARFASHPDKKFPSVLKFREYVQELARELHVKPELLKRGLNEGFSGGEKKRLEILQMAVLEPQFAILDETDSGLDVDAIRAVAEGVRHIVTKHKTGVLVITHYQRILEYLKPDFVHILEQGVITRSGGPELAQHVETQGYQVK